MRNKFANFLVFSGIFFIVFSVLAGEIGTTTEPEIGTTTEPEIGTTTEPEIGTTTEPEIGTTTEPETFEPIFFEMGLEPSILEEESYYTIFCDDFNSYTNGDLNGQGSWSGSAIFDVQGTTVYEGTKAVVATGNGEIRKIGTALTDGKLTIYFRVNNLTGWLEGGYNGIALRLGDTGDPYAPVFIKADRHLYISTWTDIGVYRLNQWNELIFEWRSTPDYKYRVTLNGGTPSGWVGSWNDGGNWTTGLDRIALFYTTGNANNFYFDYITGIPYTPPTPPAGEFNSTNTFFAYFFGFGDYLPIIFSFALVIVLVGSILNFFLILDKKKTIE